MTKIPDSEIIAWFREIERTTFDDLVLDESSKFVRIDKVLGNGLAKSMPETIKTSINKYEEAAFRECRPVLRVGGQTSCEVGVRLLTNSVNVVHNVHLS